MARYLVAAVKSWNQEAFRRRAPTLPGEWELICRRQELTLERIREVKPRFVFFPHWSWRVPREILEAVECVGFHMSDLPYGRGGTPLQNLIVRGRRTTMLSALRMVEELDAGPVYLKRALALSGSARQIYEAVAELVYDMIAEIVTREPVPVEQKGEVTVFERRTPDQSRLPERGQLGDVYDHIRMLDAPSYPRAFLDHGAFRLEFFDAELGEEEVISRVRFRRTGDD